MPRSTAVAHLLKVLTFICGISIAFCAGVDAETAYSGKQITLIVGSEVGAGYDAYARLVARHLSKHIPGSPALIVQNMPGAGGLRAANYLYNIAPKDGTVIGTFQRNLPLMSIVEKSNTLVEYDATKFTWLGSPSRGAGDAYLMIARSDVPVQKVEDLHSPGGHQLIVGGTAPGTQGHDIPVMLADILELNLKVISGYASANQTSLALMRHEIDARMIGLSALRTSHPEWLSERSVRVLLQLGRLDRHPDLKDVPLARELVANDNDLTLLSLMDVPQFMSWPFMAPPDIPPDRAAILQKAFMDTQADPDYIADAQKQDMELSPISGEDIRAMLTGIGGKLTPELMTRYQELITKIKSRTK